MHHNVWLLLKRLKCQEGLSCWGPKCCLLLCLAQGLEEFEAELSTGTFSIGQGLQNGGLGVVGFLTVWLRAASANVRANEVEVALPLLT